MKSFQWKADFLPRKQLVDEYTKVGMTYEKTVEDRAWENFYALCHQYPAGYEVEQIYRVSVKGKEFLFWNQKIQSEDWQANPHDFSVLMGRWNKPQFRLYKDPETKQIIADKTEVLSFETFYDVPFSKEKVDELLDAATDKISLIAIDKTGRKWTVSLTDFRDGEIEEIAQDRYVAIAEKKIKSSGEVQERERRGVR